MGFAFRFFAAGALFGVWTWFFGDPRDLSVVQIVHQDLIVFVLGAAVLGFVLQRRPVSALRIGADEARLCAYVSAAFAFIAGYAGAYIAALNYPLSMDEFMALFDARIIASGDLLAPVPFGWQGLAKALQPIFLFKTDASYWSSTYLPVNAALHAVMSFVDSALTAPLLAALSVLLIFAIARRIWPQRPDAAFVAVLLLVTSAQFIITAMTPYAMTAHLALNLLWLWLFLRNTGASHGGALVVGFAATGLHQLVFHPFFVAPFILSLWLGRRWRLAAAYTVGYGAICLFWILYRNVIADSAGSGEGGVSAFIAQVEYLTRLFQYTPIIVFMPRNLVRFVAWQNPFTLVLFCLALGAIRRWAFPLPQLLAGIVLTLIFVVVVPYQGHGWGYRYLHGLLGSISLIAAFAWIQFTGLEAARMRGALIACSVFAAAMLPLRAFQMRSFTEPFARASAVIAKTDADIVLVDPTGIWFGADFARNDPYLVNRPKVLLLNRLTQEDVARLCVGHKIAIFDLSTARTFGVPALSRVTVNNEIIRAFMADKKCGVPIGTSP
ncbi:hypothetical protein IZ6_22230 [Terrihabitans soli]|uniref:Glycosyltransferase RgtA/B/C/D-like domain-containing protein n=1 Tax=Terrihabitans soli TaxID=708113 RepID=A0A6S6QY43_9HYPH|nr:hypothetical protein [Terrihabitans soli]BCJ91488.1 hypothetical protein IZ6_22230 [Terrihabitans soli]